MQKIILPFFLIFLISGCNSLKDTGSSSFSDSDSPYVKEEPVVKKKSKKIVVKQEKVRVIESEEDKAFKYYIIIGSFKILDNARNYKNTLVSEGFTPLILENENGLYRVSVSAYNRENSARNKVNKIKNNYEKYNDTWLLINTL